jgi:DNA-binding GntR family transcriptional regulator
VSIPANLLPVERRVLRHEVLLGLRGGILSGQIAPGTRLLEVSLAAELGVSRGPVREALRQLEQEGLVEFFPHRGAVVVGVAEAEVETIYEIRALLEGRAFARACRVVTDEDLEALGGTVERMIEASETGDIGAVTEHDLAFHGRVVEISGFQYLHRLWTSIDGVVRSRATHGSARPDLADPVEARTLLVGSSAEHRELVDALRSRRPALASRAAMAHVNRGLERLRAAQRR